MIAKETTVPVPDPQEFMLPLLKITGDGHEHTVPEAMETLARQMQISETDRDVLLPSGTETRFHNRVSWAMYYLYRSQLLERVGHGRYIGRPAWSRSLQEESGSYRQLIP